jgi:hypothetical protein
MDRLEQDVRDLRTEVRGNLANLRNWILVLAVPSLGLMAAILTKLFV